MVFVCSFIPKNSSNLSSLLRNQKENQILRYSTSLAFCPVARKRFRQICLCCSDSGTEGPVSPAVYAKFASQRAILSSSSNDFEVDELNKLLEMAGKTRRNPQRFLRALKNSLVVVTARLISDGTLVGLTRAITDGAYNATIVELFTDIRLPKPEIIKRNMVERLIKEARSKIPDCGIVMIAPEEDVAIYEKMNFQVNPRGIRLMGMTNHHDEE
ncbi:N-acetyltransferase [Galdieria sulphuraria]|uniref:N-acetyltransferase n=1 Tax=Galdieria sulphuraria TaxID=130081 RepID=M2XUH4_GALSU|nr:N-acetyltransferase [Galdieria sulphuraria]EME27074.1 N-acetyltransferase [Galdieria sulphuraria]|eukprot:XP_005703594.1 N-acetyltransferase [Galdieria sulphuraria]